MKAKRIYAPRPRISVTDNHMDQGIQKSSTQCAIQIAFAEQMPWARHVTVDLQTIRCSNPEKGLRYIWFTPNRVMTAIIEWDYGVRPKPFSFLLRQAQIVSMRRQPGRSDQSRGGHLVHKLGRRKLVMIEPGSKKKQVRANIIGGKAPRTHPLGSRRVFGRRGLTIAGKHPYEILQEEAAQTKKS